MFSVKRKKKKNRKNSIDFKFQFFSIEKVEKLFDSINIEEEREREKKNT